MYPVTSMAVTDN